MSKPIVILEATKRGDVWRVKTRRISWFKISCMAVGIPMAATAATIAWHVAAFEA